MADFPANDPHEKTRERHPGASSEQWSVRIVRLRLRQFCFFEIGDFMMIWIDLE